MSHIFNKIKIILLLLLISLLLPGKSIYKACKNLTEMSVTRRKTELDIKMFESQREMSVFRHFLKEENEFEHQKSAGTLFLCSIPWGKNIAQQPITTVLHLGLTKRLIPKDR